MNKRKEYSHLDELNLKLVIGFSRTTLGLHRNTQRLVAAYGLTLPQFGVLEALYHLGDLKICEIIEKTLSTSGNMTVVIRNLEQEGLVHRLQSPEDRRVYRIAISEKGAAIIRELFPEHLKELEKGLARLSDREKDELIRLMKKLNGVG